MNTERIGYMIFSLLVGAGVHLYDEVYGAAPASIPVVTLSDDIKAYIDLKLDEKAKVVAAAKTPEVDVSVQVNQLKSKISTLEQTSELRAAAQAKCGEVCTEYRKLFDERASAASLVREQELNRLRTRTAATCAGSPDQSTTMPKKRAVLK